MKKIVIVCGLIAGIISSGWMIWSVASCMKAEQIDFDKGMIYGYAAMLLAFSLIFVGIKNYRDNHNGGFISFGKAFRIGLFITLVAATFYVIVWLIDYYFFVPDFDEAYTSHMLNKLKASGASQAEIDKQTQEMAGFNRMYQNPLFVALITYTEILPVGLLVSLVAALLLKRKKTVVV